MKEITFLRIMFLFTCALNTSFPWYIWLYAIILELDNLGDSFYKSGILKSQLELMRGAKPKNPDA